MRLLSTTISLAAAAAFLFAAGCENADSKDGVSWNGSGAKKKPAASAPASPGGEAAVGDEAPFGSFRWSYGGFNGAAAQSTGVVISGLSLSKDSLSFSYVTDLSAWGLRRDDAGALACFFVQKGDGSWVGGKFDWISTSRSSRGLGHVRGGYNGWSLSGVPNPCQAAFVIVSSDGRKRSNVLSGTWTR